MSSQTIAQLLIDRIEKSPRDNSIGYVESNKINFISFLKYKEVIEALSNTLGALGMQKQSKACILSDTRKEWHFFDMAIMCSNYITVPIYPSYTAKEALYILEHSEAELLIVENQKQIEKVIEIQDELKFLRTIIYLDPIKKEVLNNIKPDINTCSYEEAVNIGLNEVNSHPDKFILQIQNLAADDIASIVYTSGTTGQPKGVMITHQALFQVLQNVKKYSHSAISETDRILTYLPLSHVLGRFESFLPLLFGLEAVYAESLTKVIDNLPKAQPTLFVAVPRILEKIYEKVIAAIDENEIKKGLFKWATNAANRYYQCLDEDRTPKTLTILEFKIAQKLFLEKIYAMFGNRIRYFISGGAPLNVTILEFMRNANLTILEGYGLTETLAPCCINPLNKQILGSVGQPIGDVQIKFLDDGEILIKSSALFCGYYKDEKATKESLDDDGWFHTGDIGKFNEEGYLFITDRKKDIIITSGGKNVAPQKIESMIKLSPYISQVAIIGDGQKYLTALVAINKESIESLHERFELTDDMNIESLASHPQVIELINDELAKVNDNLASFESIKKFRILPCEIDTNNYLTPSLKLKKRELLKDFQALVSAMYKK